MFIAKKVKKKKNIPDIHHVPRRIYIYIYIYILTMHYTASIYLYGIETLI